VRAPDTNVDPAEVERMVRRAKESADGAIEWALWYFEQAAFISDDPSRWPAQSKLNLFRSKGRRRKPEEGELIFRPSEDFLAAWRTLDSEAAFRAALAGAPQPVQIPWGESEWVPNKRGRGNPASDYAKRDRALKVAAAALVRLGYRKTRNEATRHRESIASIIVRALARRGIAMNERTIEDILQNRQRKPRKRHLR
jgi:hypothetical protein